MVGYLAVYSQATIHNVLVEHDCNYIYLLHGYYLNIHSVGGVKARKFLIILSLTTVNIDAGCRAQSMFFWVSGKDVFGRIRLFQIFSTLL